MRIGINLWIWESPFRTDQHLPLLSKAKSLGAEVVEFALEDDGVVDPTELRRALEGLDLGLSVLGLFGGRRDLSNPDASIRRTGMEHAKRCLVTAGQAGAALFSGAVIGVSGQGYLSDEERRDRVRLASECLHELGEFAARAGVLFAVEILNRYESNLVNTAAEARELVELVDHPSVGIHLDSFHMNIDERSMGDAIRIAGDKLFHLHGSDSHRGTPGEGHLQWGELSTALQDIDYQRYVVIESFNSSGRLAPLARFWHAHAASPEALAYNGLKFLKSTLRHEHDSHRDLRHGTGK